MIEQLAPVLVSCVLCRHPMADALNKRIAANGIAATMRWMAENDLKVPHRNTFSEHKNRHLTEPLEKARIEATERLRKQQKTIKSKPGDLAALVRDNVFARVEQGDLEPTLAEGLRAQEMLDRRSEKQGDRDMMMQLAGLLSGATSPVALLREPSLEGTFVVLGEERDEDTSSFVALLNG